MARERYCDLDCKERNLKTSYFKQLISHWSSRNCLVQLFPQGKHQWTKSSSFFFFFFLLKFYIGFLSLLLNCYTNSIRLSNLLFYTPETSVSDFVLCSIAEGDLESSLQWTESLPGERGCLKGPRQIPVWKEPAISWVVLFHVAWFALMPSIALSCKRMLPSEVLVAFVGCNVSPEIKPIMLYMAFSYGL